MKSVLKEAATRSVKSSLTGGSLRIPAVRYAAVRKPGHEPARDQDLEPVAVKIALDLSFPLAGEQPARQRQAEHFFAVEEAQEINDHVAEQDAAKQLPSASGQVICRCG